MAKTTSVFQGVLTAASNKGTIPKKTRGAVKWLRKIAKRATNRLIDSGLGFSGRKKDPTKILESLVGNMYIFNYDPIGKSIMPYWDERPLVIPIQLTNDGFLGLNFHYLDLKRRAILLDVLLDFEIKEDADERDTWRPVTKLKNIDYGRLNAIARYKYFRPCLKRYKFNRIGGKLIALKRDEWDTALFLPIAKFKGDKNQQDVWQESISKI